MNCLYCFHCFRCSHCFHRLHCLLCFTASIAHTAYAVYIASYTACLNTVDIVYTADILLKQCVFSYMSILL